MTESGVEDAASGSGLKDRNLQHRLAYQKPSPLQANSSRHGKSALQRSIRQNHPTKKRRTASPVVVHEALLAFAPHRLGSSETAAKGDVTLGYPSSPTQMKRENASHPVLAQWLRSRLAGRHEAHHPRSPHVFVGRQPWESAADVALPVCPALGAVALLDRIDDAVVDQ